MATKALGRKTTVSLNDALHSNLKTPSTLLLASEVAVRLRVTEKALEHWRRRGIGPSFIRLGRNCIRYRSDKVEDFVDEVTKTRSTNSV